MREVLGRLIELSGMRRLEIGERLGGGPHLVRWILSGETELKARHVVEIAELIGVRPIEYFRIVFDDESREPSPLIRAVSWMRRRPKNVKAVSRREASRGVRLALARSQAGSSSSGARKCTGTRRSIARPVSRRVA